MKKVSNFSVDKDGNLVAKNAKISGTISSNANGDRITIDAASRSISYINSTNQLKGLLNFRSNLAVLILGDTNMDSEFSLLSQNLLNIDDGVYNSSVTAGSFQSSVNGKNPSNYFYLSVAGSTVTFQIKGLPTSSSGLSTGSIYRNGNYLMIV